MGCFIKVDRYFISKKINKSSWFKDLTKTEKYKRNLIFYSFTSVPLH